MGGDYSDIPLDCFALSVGNNTGDFHILKKNHLFFPTTQANTAQVTQFSTNNLDPSINIVLPMTCSVTRHPMIVMQRVITGSVLTAGSSSTEESIIARSSKC